MSESITERLLAFLRANGATFTALTHEPVRTSAEAAQVRGTPLEQEAKALICHADDRTILIVLPADRRLDSRAFKRERGVKNLRMVSAEELHALTGLEPGAVPPFGALFGLPTYVDARLLDQPQLAFNAGSRSTSLILPSADYARLAEATVGHFSADADERPANPAIYPRDAGREER
jgi:Ala-tRNA(Pro) deacylase